jgi:hypothetical protein
VTAIEVLLPELLRAGPPFVDLQLARYEVIVAPPLYGAWKLTVILPFPGATEGANGLDGLVTITMVDEGTENGPAPLEFLAKTRHVYVLPGVNGVTVIGDAAPTTSPDTPPFVDVQLAVKSMIAEPPVNGGTKVTRMFPVPATTVGFAGAAGTAFGTTDTDGTDGRPSPLAFVANTVHVYVEPFVNTVTMIGDAEPVTVDGVPPSDDVQVAEYPVIGEPPSAGATKPTVIVVSPATTVGCAGGSGTACNTTTGADAGDTAPSPFAFDANTVHV